MTSSGQRESWQMGPIEDARGRRVAQLDPVLLHAVRRHDVIPAEALAAIAGEVGVGMTRANRILLWSSITGVLCLAIALTILLVRHFNGTIGIGKLLRSLIPFIGVMMAPYGLWMGTRAARFRRITKIMLEHRRCPHCGYDLQGSPIDEQDGVTVCPECGCAWRLGAGDGPT